MSDVAFSEKPQEPSGLLQTDMIRDCRLFFMSTLSQSPQVPQPPERLSEISRLEMGTGLHIHVCPKCQGGTSQALLILPSSYFHDSSRLDLHVLSQNIWEIKGRSPASCRISNFQLTLFILSQRDLTESTPGENGWREKWKEPWFWSDGQFEQTLSTRTAWGKWDCLSSSQFLLVLQLLGSPKEGFMRGAGRDSELKAGTSSADMSTLQHQGGLDQSQPHPRLLLSTDNQHTRTSGQIKRGPWRKWTRTFPPIEDCILF